MFGISDVADLHFAIGKLCNDIGIIISSKAKIIPVFRKELRHGTLRFVLVHRQERHHRFARSKDQTDCKQRRHRQTVKWHFLLFQIKAQYRQCKNKNRNIIPWHHGTGGENKHKQIQYKADFQEKCDQAAKSCTLLRLSALHRNISVDAQHCESRHGHNTTQG